MPIAISALRNSLCSLILLPGLLLAGPATAQGHGGGHQGGGHGRGEQQHASKPATEITKAADPLVAFFDGLHTLRVQVLVRDNQAPAWAAMRDAVRAYVDSSRGPTGSAADPLEQLHRLSEDSRSRAASLTKVESSVAAVAQILDEGQRQIFVNSLADDFAASR